MRTANDTIRIYRRGVRSIVAPMTDSRPKHEKKLANMTADACATNSVRYASNVLKTAVTASGKIKHAARLRSTANSAARKRRAASAARKIWLVDRGSAAR